MQKSKKFVSKKPSAIALRWLTKGAAYITIGFVLFLILYITVKGVPHLSFDMFAWNYTSDNVSLMPALINTVLLAVLSLLIAVPLGVFAAIYMVEYAKRGSKFVGLVRITAETLSGIPSIVYGLFGMLFFVTSLKWGLSLLAGACTIAIMILPTIMRTTEEALLAVPDQYREGSFALGAGRVRTVFRVILPSSINGIVAGIILAIGRIVGETAALIYTAGTVAQVPDSLFASGRTLAIHMYMLSSEGLYIDKAYATAFVLLLLVVGINALSGYIARRIGKGNK